MTRNYPLNTQVKIHINAIKNWRQGVDIHLKDTNNRFSVVDQINWLVDCLVAKFGYPDDGITDPITYFPKFSILLNTMLSFRVCRPVLTWKVT